MRLLSFLLIFWFLLKGSYIALHASPGAGPDEMFHLQMIDMYASGVADLGNPGNLLNAKFARFGSTVRMPHLYHVLCSFLVNAFDLEVYSFSTILYLRFLNILLAIGTLVCSIALWKVLGLTLAQSTLALAIQSNLLMNTALSASVGYDITLNLCAVIYLLLILKLLSDWSWSRLFTAGTIASLGALTKVSMLPLIVLSVPAIVAAVIGQRRGVVAQKWKPPDFKSIGIGICFILSFALCTMHYGFNFKHYGHVRPSCEALFGEADCRQHHYTAVNNHCESPKIAAPNLLAYLPFWALNTLGGIHGIRSHLCVHYPFRFIKVSLGLFLILYTIVLLRFRRLSSAFQWSALLGLSYMGFVLLYWNYWFCPAFVSMGINGRYLFPVLPLLSASLAYALLAPLRPELKRGASLAFGMMFVFLEFPFAYLTPSFHNYLSPQPRVFYETLPYFPNPIFDENFSLVDEDKS